MFRVCCPAFFTFVYADRSKCGCQATQHDLIGNCTVCGRVICTLEGEGSCFFCHSYVTADGTVPSKEFVHSMSVMSGRGHTHGHRHDPKHTTDVLNGVNIDNKSSTKADKVALESATKHKDKLLRFARNNARSSLRVCLSWRRTGPANPASAPAATV